MGKIKYYYTEILLSLAVMAAATYFVYSFYSHRANAEFLSQAKSKLLLAQARANRNIEEKITQAEDASYKSSFEVALKDSGFEILKLEKKSDRICATVVKNYQAYEKISSLLENIEYKEYEQSAEISWTFNIQKELNEKIINSKPIFTLSGICFMNQKDWQIWVNGKMYDNDNSVINSDSLIKSVTESEVIIQSGNEKIILTLQV
jgi:hypothetical protein